MRQSKKLHYKKLGEKLSNPLTGQKKHLGMLLRVFQTRKMILTSHLLEKIIYTYLIFVKKLIYLMPILPTNAILLITTVLYQ